MYRAVLFSILLTAFGFFAQAYAKVSILIPSTYYPDDVKDVKDGQEWIGLVPSNGNMLAKHVKISIEMITENCGRGSEPAMNVTTPLDNVALLVKGLSLKEGEQVKTYPIVRDQSHYSNKRAIGYLGMKDRYSFQDQGQTFILGRKMVDKKTSTPSIHHGI